MCGLYFAVSLGFRKHILHQNRVIKIISKLTLYQNDVSANGLLANIIVFK